MQTNYTDSVSQAVIDSCPMLEALEAAHAIVCTFTIENETQDQALNKLSIVKMLRGVDTLLSQAQASKCWPNLPSFVGAPESSLPEAWMFKLPEFKGLDQDLLGTTCCRAGAVIAVYIALGEQAAGYEQLAENDYIHGLWALEGIIAQAIAIVEIARPAEPQQRAAA